MLDQSNELAAWDRDHFFHPSTHMGTHARGETPTRIITGGEGVYIADSDGTQQPRRLRRPLLRQCRLRPPRRSPTPSPRRRKKLAYYHAYVGHGTEASITLAKMIIDRAPKGMSRVYFGLSGSDANETNIKLVWYYNNVLGRPEKKKIISRWRGYHGSGLMTGSLTGLELFHNAFDLPRAADPAHRGALLLPPRRPLDERGAVLAALRRQARGADPAPKGRTPSPPSSASRCSAPAASCRRRPATGRRSRRC